MKSAPLRNVLLRQVLTRFATYVVPAIIGLTTVVAMFAFPSQYPVVEGQPVSFRVFQSTQGGWSPATAAKALRALPDVSYVDSHLSEDPFWLQFFLDKSARLSSVIEFPSRHAVTMDCWDQGSNVLLGSADRSGTRGLLLRGRTGFILDADKITGNEVVCRVTTSGPARITVNTWDKSVYDAAVKVFQRDSGLLDGGLIVLSLFVFITALINREAIYVVFSGWLILNLRLAGLSTGWDTQWFGHEIPGEWLEPVRKVGISFYYVLTVTLFSSLFREDSRRIGYEWTQNWLRWSCVPMLALIVLPYRWYLPVMWATAGISISIIVFLMIRLIYLVRSKTAIWFAAAMVVAMFSSFSEIIAAALGVKQVLEYINSVTAALVSSLMAALAIAQQMRIDRVARVSAETELRKNYEEIPIGLFTLDRSGTLVRGNPALLAMIEETAPSQRPWSAYFGQEAWNSMAQALLANESVEMEVCETMAHDHGARWFLVKAKLAGSSIEGSLQDITQRVQATERLNYLAEHDPLTDTYNRRGIEKLLTEVLEHVSQGAPACLAYLDLDRFKLVNDIYGHRTGDIVLQQVCERIQPILKPRHHLARIGGDEFVLIFGGSKLVDAAIAGESILDVMHSTPFSIEDKAFRVAMSIGITEIGPGMSAADAINRADRACQEAKLSSGQLCVLENNAEVFVELEKKVNFLKQFSINAPPEGLFVVMQPIMSLHAPYKSLNFEVLLRMRRPDGEIESAGAVITTAEANGRIAMIDRWVLSHVLEWVEKHSDGLKHTQFLSLNLSGGSLNDERFVADAFAIMASHPKAIQRVCLEITESVAIRDIANIMQFVERARDLGAKIALDDFGAGYTSFSYLTKLPADILKLDGSFVKGALVHPANMSVIESVCSLTHNLGMSSIAEWTEDVDTVKAMVEAGIDYVQGFCIARPQMPAAILKASSSADFIQDPDTLEYVKTYLAGHSTPDFWGHIPGLKTNLH